MNINAQYEYRALDRGLKHLAKLIKDKLNIDVEDYPGAGAAGGFGGGAMAFFKAKLVPGIETILDWFDADSKLEGADWLISGEGCLDATSFQGKVVGGICGRYGSTEKLNLAALAGVVRVDEQDWRKVGLSYAGQCMKAGQSEADAFKYAEENFVEALERFYTFVRA